MTITYKRPFGDRTSRQVILHKVEYGQPAKEIFTGSGHGYKLMPKHPPEVLQWCCDNCKADWYKSQDGGLAGLTEDRLYIEFEDDEDAVMFALRWS